MIRRLLIWILASTFALLPGCYSLRPETRPVNTAEAEIIGETVADWSAARLPEIKSVCSQRVKNWRVGYLRGEELQNLCTKRSCFIDDSRGFVFWPEVYPTAIIPEHHSAEKRAWHLRHQTLRWLSWCAGLGLDPQEKNEDVWRLDR